MARSISLGSGTHLSGGAGQTLAAALGSTVLPDVGSTVESLVGVLCPDTFYAPPTLGDYTPMGGGLIRLPGGDAPTSITLDDGHGGAWFGFIQPVPLPRFQLSAGPPAWAAIASGTTSFSLTLTASGPLSSVSKAVTLSIVPGAVMLADNVFVDTMGFSAITSTAATVTDGAGFFAPSVDGYGNNRLVNTASATPAGLHYGQHSFTLTGPGGTPQATSVFVVQERAAIWDWASAATLYSNLIAGDTLGQFTAAAEPGIYALSYVSSDTPVTISPTGQVLAQATHTTGTHSATILITSMSGKATSVTFSYVVAAGTTLPASAMTASFAALDNSMTNGTLGTVTVSGMTAPTWSIDVANDEVQRAPSLAPRYALAASGNVATITYTALSAQTDELVLVATQGSSICRATIPNPVAWKVGPTKTVGPSSSGTYDFPTWNALADAAWTNPAAYAGVTIELYPQDYSADFNRTQIGHGSSQQYLPGPWRMIGVNPAGGRVLVDFKGNAPYGAKGGIGFINFDGYCENIELANVSNLGFAEGNAGGFYKEGATNGNMTLKNCVARNCNMGMLGGWEGTHIVFDTTAFYNCGTGAGGLVHNVYVGHASSVTATNCISLNTAQVHAFKSRAYRTTLTGCVIADGENGTPGASSNVDLPLGGIASISGCTLTRGPNPNNDGNWIQWCAEGSPTGGNGPCHPVNTLSVTNTTFQNAKPAGSSSGTGVALFNANGNGAISPTTGLAPTVTMGSNSFYNMTKTTWWGDYVSPPVHVTDAGGNAATTTWTDVSAADPVYTGQNLPAPAPSFALNGANGSAMMGDPLAPQIKVAVGTAVGTVVARLTGYDDAGVELTNRSTTLSNTAGGVFAVDSATGNISVAGTIANALYFIAGTVSGTASDGSTQGYAGYNGAPKAIFIVGGTGAS